MIYAFLSLTLLVPWASVQACSNLLLTKEAMVDQANTISYNADSAALYGSLYHYPAATNKAGTMKQIYDWDTGVYLGEIALPEETYNVVGNTNEWGVIIGETTSGGLAELQEQEGAVMDYGSLIYTTLQMAKTARDAIHIADRLMQTYGYASEGESFSIADQNEVWVMEIIGKGNYEKGAVWVAAKIPAGAVSAHANQARITTFPKNKPDEVLYAADVVTFARKIGVYAGSDDDFSYSDVYDPVTFEGARFCEARVWSFFAPVMGEEFATKYWDYAAGYNLTNRMPLYVFPPEKLSLTKTMEHMRSHYEGTYFDMTGSEFNDVGAEDASMPVRAHPLTWTDTKGADYFHERPIATPQTGWNFVAQSRAWMPRGLASVLWFGVDDSSTTVRFPIHGGATRVPTTFAGPGTQDGFAAPILSFNWNSAFTVFNVVANFAYNRWSVIYPDVLKEILSLEAKYTTALQEVDEQASVQYTAQGREAALETVTTWACNVGNDLTSHWGAFFGNLFMKFRDQYVITADPDEPSCGCAIGSSPYEDQWYDRIAEGTGAHYKVPADAAEAATGLRSGVPGMSASRVQKQRAVKRALLAKR